MCITIKRDADIEVNAPSLWVLGDVLKPLEAEDPTLRQWGRVLLYTKGACPESQDSNISAGSIQQEVMQFCEAKPHLVGFLKDQTKRKGGKMLLHLNDLKSLRLLSLNHSP